MNDPMTSLYSPPPAIDPDPAFAARLRSRLQDLLLDDQEGDIVMTDNTIAAAKANEHIA